MLIAFGLLYSSRIAFSLSVIGFYLAYLFYSIFGADVNDLNYNLLGSNFIFIAIAIGCFFNTKRLQLHYSCCSSSYFIVGFIITWKSFICLSIKSIFIIV